MATEEYQTGYDAGYQDGWNAAQQPQAEKHASWCASRSMLMSNPPQSRPCDCKPHHKTAPQQADAVPAKEDFCYCNDEISLQIVSGGGAPEGLYGRVTLKISGEYVNYVRADSWQETPMARALEFVARHKSSDWPERCQQMVDMARAALAAPQQTEAVPPGYAGVMVWIGDKQVTRVVTETQVNHERERGIMLKGAAMSAVAMALALKEKSCTNQLTSTEPASWPASASIAGFATAAKSSKTSPQSSSPKPGGS